ncbi:MAG: chromate transporter [Firmicutes bacterium]|nr:chromate transporter [Bacillota bacterium]
MIFLTLFLTFFKIGISTFGGGYAMIPMIQAEVLSHGWMTQEELINFIAVSESTPGPFAVNISTYVGTQTGGLPGAVCATFGVVLPSFLIILLVARCFLRFRSSRLVSAAMDGLRPAVVGLIASAAVSIAQTVFPLAGIGGFAAFFSSEAFFALLIFAVSAVLIFWKKLHPIPVIAAAAVLGIALCCLRDLLAVSG